MTGPVDTDELRRRYAELPDEAPAEAHAAGEASYQPMAWQVLRDEISSRHLALGVPEERAKRRLFPVAFLVQRFLDAKWPLVVNTVSVVLMVVAIHYVLGYMPSVAQRLLHLVALLAVAGLFLLGTWLRSQIVEGLVAAVYAYEVCLNVVRGIAAGAPGAALQEPALRMAGAISFWGLLAVMAGLCVYFGCRFVRPFLRPSSPTASDDRDPRAR
jgi:hypothetical protein